MKTKNIKLDKIVPNPRNPRVITSIMLSKLKKSIQDFPEMLNVRPIILDDDNTILAGNMRYKCLVELGWKEAPCIYASELSEEEKDELLIKNNLSYGDWDWDDIVANWNIQDIKNWGVDVPAFYFDDDVEPEFEEVEDLNRIKRLIITFGRDEYKSVLDNLNAVIRREGLADYSEAVLFLMNKYENN
jgi:ParB-like chromosome segregation protein Spo0J